MKSIVIDIDDCVANIRNLVSYACSKESGRNVSWQQWTSYDWGDFYGHELDYEDLMTRWHVLERATLEDEFWWQVVVHAKQQGLYVVFMSARGWHSNARDLTENWLLDNGIGFDELVLVKHGESKRAKIAAMGLDPQWIIEDSPHNLIELNETYPDRLIRIQRPWNVNIETKHTARDGYEVLNILRGQNVVSGS